MMLAKLFFYILNNLKKYRLNQSKVISERNISVQNFFYKYLPFRVRNVFKFYCGSNKPLYVALNAIFITITK